MKPTEKKTSSLLIRRAKLEDIDTLVDICRETFPDAIEWRAPRFSARKSWCHALTSAASETWVCSTNGEVAGCVTLVTDEAAHAREKRKRAGGFLAKSLTLVTCPRLLFLRIFKRKLGWPGSPEKCRSTVKSAPSQEQRTWIEPMAVSPHMRRKGLAKKMLEHCEKRTLELNRDTVKLLVDLDNRAAIELYEKWGFVRVHQTSAGYVYAKILK